VTPLKKLVEQQKAQSNDSQKNDPGTSVHHVWKSFTPEQLDNLYGIRELSRGRQKIGSKLVFFDQDKIYVGDDVCPLSKGLLELIFKKIPDEKLIEDQDLKHYKDILLKSNAHRVQNRSSGRLRTSNVPKFRLISELLEMRGAGLRSNSLKAMNDHLIAKKNENKHDSVDDSRGSKVQNQEHCGLNKVDEYDNGVGMDDEEADEDTEDDDEGTDKEEGEEEVDEDTDADEVEEENEEDEDEEEDDEEYEGVEGIESKGETEDGTILSHDDILNITALCHRDESVSVRVTRGNSCSLTASLV